MTNPPLSGIRVVAVEQAVAMPFCTFILTELGAEVVKVERLPDGDTIRSWDDAVHGLSAGFVWVNSNKKSICLNLAHSEAQEIVRQLCRTADVFVENFAPGVIDRFGLSYDELKNVNEEIVYCSLSGYGQTGPYRAVKAFDLLVQGESGLLNANGSPAEPAKVGIPISDLIAGSNATIAILAALRAPRDGTRGQYIDLGMFESVLPWLGYYPHRIWHTQTEPPRTGLRHQYLSPYGPFLAKDDVLVNVAVATQEHWHRFCKDVIETPDWITDSRFATVADRQQNRSTLEAMIDVRIAGEPSEIWFDRLERSRLPYGRVRTIADAIRHPQVGARACRWRRSRRLGRFPCSGCRSVHCPTVSDGSPTSASTRWTCSAISGIRRGRSRHFNNRERADERAPRGTVRRR